MSRSKTNNSILIESNFETETLCEESGGKKNWYIRGIFMQTDVLNKNGRIYPGGIMESSVSEYVNNFVKTKRAVGELSHPSTLEINLDRVSHLIEDIKRDGKTYIGKARLLNTPMGKIAEGLLEGGVKLGVSSRGGGRTINESGADVVQPGFNLRTVDIVYSPSAPAAFVDGLMEGQSFVWNTLEEDTQLLESLKKDIRKTSSKNLTEAKIAAFDKFMKALKG